MGKSSEQTSYPDKANLLFERFLRHGQRWKAREIERDTEGEVSGSYISALLKGKIQHPGDQIQAKLADTMGFPPSLWELEPTEWDAELERVREEAARSREHLESSLQPTSEVNQYPADSVPSEQLAYRELADLLNHLFETMLNRRTGQRHTEQQIAIYSGGTLNAGEIRKMRDGESPPVRSGKLVALSDAFEIHPSYWTLMSRHEAQATGLEKVQRFIKEGDMEGAVGRNPGSSLSEERPGRGLTQGDKSAMLKLIEYLGIEERSKSERGDGGERKL